MIGSGLSRTFKNAESFFVRYFFKPSWKCCWFNTFSRFANYIFHSCLRNCMCSFVHTVKPVCNDHLWDWKKWLLFRGGRYSGGWSAPNKFFKLKNEGVVWKQKLYCQTENPNFDWNVNYHQTPCFESYFSEKSCQNLLKWSL